MMRWKPNGQGLRGVLRGLWRIGLVALAICLVGSALAFAADWYVGEEGDLFFSQDNNHAGLYLLDTTTGSAVWLGYTGVITQTTGLAPYEGGWLFGSRPGYLTKIAADGSGYAFLMAMVSEGLAYDSLREVVYSSVQYDFRYVDPVTLVGVGLPMPGSDVEGLAYDSTRDLVFGIGGDSLLRVYDPTSTTWSVVGDTGIPWDNCGLAYDPGQDLLYAVTGIGSTSLYTIDPVTAATSVVGQTGLHDTAGGLAFLLWTIQQTIDAAADGDTIHVRVGDYEENLVVYRPLTLAGEAGATIDGGGSDVVTVNGVPVVITGLGIANGGHGILVNGDLLAEDVISSNSVTGNSRCAIRVDDVDGGWIIGNIVEGNSRCGIRLDDVYGGARIDGNTVSNSGYCGIRLDDLWGGASVDGNTVSDSEGCGIRLDDLWGGASVDGNTVIDSECFGIRLDDLWGGASVDGNTVIDSEYCGIRLDDLWGRASVDGNTVIDSEYCGIRLDYLWGRASVDGNTVIDSDNCGIRLYGLWGGSSIDGNFVIDSGYCGIRLDWMRGASSIDGNVVAGSGASGIHVGDLWNPASSIGGNDILGNGANGIIVEMLHNGSLSGNVISGNALDDIYWTCGDWSAVGGPDNTAGIHIWEVGCAGEAHWNSISGNGAGIIVDLGTLDAILNWWGDASGPSGEGTGTGDSVSANVIFSPWLGIDPDDDPTTPGVQLVSPMLIVVDEVGPPPTEGYLNAAIAGANSALLDGHDTIEVRPGTYGVDEEITDGVSILSTEGACETTLTGEIEIGTAGVLLGEIRNGFRIDGNVRVLSGQDASLSALHWNDIYGMVENAGIGTLDATYNFWGAGGPIVQTIGSVDVYPDLPLSSCTIIGYIDDDGMTVAEALIFGGMIAEGYSEAFARTATEIVMRCGIGNRQALGLILEYGHSRVKSALRRTRTCEEFYELLEGYAMPAGAGGAAPESVVVGEPLNVALVIVDPLTGDAVTDALVTVTVCREDVEPVEIAYFGVLPYDVETGMYGDAIDTTGWEPGTYRIYMGTDRMSWSEDVVEVTAP